VERLRRIPRERMVGWSDDQLEAVVRRLSHLSARTPDQEALLRFLSDAL